MTRKPSDYLARDIYQEKLGRLLTDEELESDSIMAEAFAAVNAEQRRQDELMILAMAAAAEDSLLQPTKQKKERKRAPGPGVVQTKYERLQGLLQYLPSLERQAVEDALDLIKEGDKEEQEWGLKMLEKVLYARVRGVKKASFDRQKRTIIGARVNRDFADLCKAAAEERGMSVTKWCHKALVDALMKHLDTTRNDVEPPYLLR